MISIGDTRVARIAGPSVARIATPSNRSATAAKLSRCPRSNPEYERGHRSREQRCGDETNRHAGSTPRDGPAKTRRSTAGVPAPSAEPHAGRRRHVSEHAVHADGRQRERKQSEPARRIAVNRSCASVAPTDDSSVAARYSGIDPSSPRRHRAATPRCRRVALSAHDHIALGARKASRG